MSQQHLENQSVNFVSLSSATPGAPRTVGRRSFLRNLGLTTVLLSPMVGTLGKVAQGALVQSNYGGSINAGDAAILQFLAAAELIEADLWQQYTELATGNDAYMEAIEAIDDDFPQYISDNTDDEISHATFINAFLTSVGETPVNLDPFRTLPSSRATGAKQIGRLTNLMNLHVDTSWWIRYRSRKNPDFGATFPQLLEIKNRPAIPPHNFPKGSKEIQAIANTAAFHFGTIEQGGSSLYTAMAELASDLTVLRIVTSILGAEVFHFAIWNDGAGNVPPVRVPGVTFPDIEDKFEGDPLREKDLIMPEPCAFIDSNLPLCSVVRPSSLAQGGALAAATALTESNLFEGQTDEFFQTLRHLAMAADAAVRSCA